MKTLLLVAAAASLVTIAAAAASLSPWAELAERDLQAIHDAIRDNHPGPVDPQNPHFRDWMERGLTIAEGQASTARNYTDYTRALRRYVNGFEDGHIELDFPVLPQSLDWPGFVAGDPG